MTPWNSTWRCFLCDGNDGYRRFALGLFGISPWWRRQMGDGKTWEWFGNLRLTCNQSSGGVTHTHTVTKVMARSIILLPDLSKKNVTFWKKMVIYYLNCYGNPWWTIWQGFCFQKHVFCTCRGMAPLESCLRLSDEHLGLEGTPFQITNKNGQRKLGWS